MVQPLPSSFTSLYRLFLRASSTSVLHHRGATRNLRKLWRPSFDGAAKVIRQLETPELTQDRRIELEKWYTTWNERMDNTLSLLCSSSLSRGLAHKLTRNLGLLCLSRHQWLSRQPALKWKPQLVGRRSRPMSNWERQLFDWEQWDEDHAWAALGQVVQMAEGRQGISLGRVTLKGSMPPPK